MISNVLKKQQKPTRAFNKNTTPRVVARSEISFSFFSSRIRPLHRPLPPLLPMHDVRPPWWQIEKYRVMTRTHIAALRGHACPKIARSKPIKFLLTGARPGFTENRMRSADNLLRPNENPSFGDTRPSHYQNINRTCFRARLAGQIRCTRRR